MRPGGRASGDGFLMRARKEPGPARLEIFQADGEVSANGDTVEVASTPRARAPFWPFVSPGQERARFTVS
jgi:hypothetical protein